MSRASLEKNLALGIGAATLGLISLFYSFSDSFNGPGYCAISFPLLAWGFTQIVRTTQSLEITPTEIIYQTAFEIARVEWDEIDTFVLDADRFVALSERDKRILLDLTLRADDQAGWPHADCTRAVEWIEHKMQEIGASRQSATWLRGAYGIHIS